MGYTTDFYGEFTIEPPLTPEQVAYLKAFNETRRMARDAAKASELPDPIRQAVGLPIGPQGAYFVGGTGFMGQEEDASTIDGNGPPQGQPSLWCQWVASEDGKALAWDEGEKFYSYADWLEYIVDHFLTPWGRTLNGEVEWQGEDRDDRGLLVVRDNVVSTKGARVTFE